MNRGTVIVGALFVVLIGTTIGVLLYGAQISSNSPSVTPTPWASAYWTPTTGSGSRAPTPAPRVVVGGTYRLANLGRLRVNRIGMEAWNRAEADKDKRSQDRIGDAFESFFVDAGTLVQIVVSEGSVR